MLFDDSAWASGIVRCRTGIIALLEPERREAGLIRTRTSAPAGSEQKRTSSLLLGHVPV